MGDVLFNIWLQAGYTERVEFKVKKQRMECQNAKQRRDWHMRQREQQKQGGGLKEKTRRDGEEQQRRRHLNLRESSGIAGTNTCSR